MRMVSNHYQNTCTIFRVSLLIACLWCTPVFSQNLSNKAVEDQVFSLDTNARLSGAQKLSRFYGLKKEFERSKLKQDSVYAKICHKIGVYELLTNNNYEEAIAYTLDAIRVNMSGEKGSSKSSAISSYYNVGSFYKWLRLFDKSLSYYDTAIALAQKFQDTAVILDAKLQQADIYFKIGDYEKSINESTIGIQYALLKKDTTKYVFFLNEKAQSLFFQNQFDQSLSYLETVINLSDKIPPFQLATAYKTKGLIYEKNARFAMAESFFRKSIEYRKLTNDNGQIASDYNDLGNFYLNSLRNYAAAKKCYFTTIEYADKEHDSVRLALAYTDLAENSFNQHKYKESAHYSLEAAEKLKMNTGKGILQNPAADSLNLIGNKSLVFQIMNNKTKLLLHLFKDNKDQQYLNACLQTALVTDTLITLMRHEQSEEGSKLYWRNKTRSFFTNALEASYLSNNTTLAFYFMEKCRSVLLTDRLNELSAAATLPAKEALAEQQFQMNIIQEGQKLAQLNPSYGEYKAQELKLLEAKNNLKQHIKGIEQNYPLYYEYKYADTVDSLSKLQRYLAANRQSFIYYFMNDTAAYILGITPAGTKLIKLTPQHFDSRQITTFLQLCSDKNKLNNNYPLFTSSSYGLYKALFQPLQIPRGRVIICPDNFIIPFEALCADSTGAHFLINDFAFSYVYSARSLMKKENARKGSGNFIGFAPVTFQPYLKVPDLEQSAASLERCAAYYNHTKLFTNRQATRYNFFHSISGYDIVNIFSHASADTTGNEPLLILQDSIIKLSELQMLQNPVTKLVVLSACETNVGKNATGEGIYSMARGFAAAGIPAVTATLWKAEEGSIYTISQKLHEYLSQGIRKDEALQKAKLHYIQNSSGQMLMPYYWANMILIGNAEPVALSNNSTLSGHSKTWWIDAGITLLIICVPVGIALTRTRSIRNRKKGFTLLQD